MEFQPFYILAILVPVLVLGFISSIMLIISMFGWRALAAQYRTDRPMPSHRRQMQDMTLSLFASYNRAVTFGADIEGVYMRTFALFRLGHPPLFIPWGEIEMQPNTFQFGPLKTERIRLTFASAKGVVMTIRPGLADFLLGAMPLSE